VSSSRAFAVAGSPRGASGESSAITALEPVEKTVTRDLSTPKVLNGHAPVGGVFIKVGKYQYFLLRESPNWSGKFLFMKMI